MCESVYAQIPLTGTDEEEWRPVTGFEGVYEVSSHGRVRRIVAARTTYAGRIFVGAIDDKGYVRIRLTNNGKSSVKKIHLLVCEAFHGPKPPEQMCNHLDGVKTHNLASNLEWTTAAGNVHHAQRMGLVPALKGEANGRVVLSDDAVREIRRRYECSDVLQRELGKEFGVSQRTISNVVLRKQWRHL